MNAPPRAAAIVQARLNSSRQPAKVMLDLAGRTLLQRVLDRVRQSRVLDSVWLATSDRSHDDVIADAAGRCGVAVFRGSLDDVLERYRSCAAVAGCDVVVRCTADNALTEPRFIDLGVARLVDRDLDYLRFRDMPYGSGVEVFTRAALERAAEETRDPFDREHVCPYFYREPGRFRIETWENPLPAATRRPEVRVTLDDLVDYERLYKLFAAFGDREPTLEEALGFLDSLPPDPGAVDR